MTVLLFAAAALTLTAALMPRPAAAVGPASPDCQVRVEEVAVPAFDDASSIWGATGTDGAGRLWVGVSAHDPGGSAHLMRLAPDGASLQDAGAVNGHLQALGLARPGEGQVKIHSRLEPSADGWLYFTSMDEAGEREDGSALPRWGSHLWRVDPASARWEHVLAAPEGLVALGVAGHHVFALGYWDHVLLHLDLRDGRVTRTVVGAVGGHASRNLVVDGRGRAFVPRVRRAGDGALQAELAEFVPGRGEVAATALPGYFRGETPEANHGVVAVLRLADGGALFTTHHGELHRIHPDGDGPSRVEALGPVHPAGPSYAPSLFALGPPDRVAAVARTARGFQWVVRDLGGGACAADLDLGGRREVLLYGSMAGEPGGGFYLGGWQRRDEAGGHRPLLLRVRPGD